ncbi:MAG: MFS transporter [Alicyclobacillus sp.]|nr:MFS transporter [Alicyclobacillus sp.]
MSNLWRNRDFVWLMGGQTVSEFGSAITGFALPWLLLQMSRSAMQMGFAFAVQMVPYLLASLPAGVYADRFNRKALMMFADSTRLLLVVSIPLAHALGGLTIAQLYGVLALMGVCNAVFDAAYVACLPNVVERSQLQAANAGLQAGVSASQMLGPALAGALVSWLGTSNTLWLDGGSFAFSVVTLWLIRRPFSAAHPASGQPALGDAGAVPAQPANPRPSMLRQMGEGLAYVWHHPLIRVISLFTLIGNLANAAFNAVMMYHMEYDIHLSAHWVGLVMSSFSVGTVSGSILAGLISRRLRMGTIMAVALALQVVPMFVYAVVPWAWALMAVNFLTGFAGVNWNVQSVTLRQSVIPDHLLGRASSAIRMVVWGAMPAGSAAGGVLAQMFGAPLVFVCGGLIQTGVFIAGWFTPLFRSTGREGLVVGEGTASSSIGADGGAL